MRQYRRRKELLKDESKLNELLSNKLPDSTKLSFLGDIDDLCEGLTVEQRFRAIVRPPKNKEINENLKN